MKKIKFLAMLLMAITLSLGFTSCSDDDDDAKDSELIGSWELYGDWGSEIWTFNSDGSFTLFGNEFGDYYSEYGKFTYNKSSKELEIIYTAETDYYIDYYIDKYIVISINSQSLVLKDNDDMSSGYGEITTLMRK